MPLYLKASTSSILQKGGSLAAASTCCCISGICGCSASAPRQFEIDMSGFTDDTDPDTGISGICGDNGSVACGSVGGLFVVTNAGGGSTVWSYTGGGYNITLRFDTSRIGECAIDIDFTYRAGFVSPLGNCCRVECIFTLAVPTPLDCMAISGLTIPLRTQFRHSGGQNDCDAASAVVLLTAV